MLTIWNYRLRFVAPAFMGDADRNGAWRTPPLKAQLRQWWRVAYAADHHHQVDVDRMRKDEAALFGAAADRDGDSQKSQVRLRLDHWKQGRLSKSQWQSLGRVRHPEVKVIKPVTADLYLGYGPITLKVKDAPLKADFTIIQAGEEATLSVALTSKVNPGERERLQLALLLMHHYGAVGGRSRNGWGSYMLEPQEGTPPFPKMPVTLLRHWRDALQLDWAHAVGMDERGPLVWATKTHPDWRAAMVELAQLKIDLRVSLGFQTGAGAEKPELRHWLAYPVTNHSVRAWGEERLPNTLRFKLRPVGDGKVQGLVFHMPAFPPVQFRPQGYRADIDALWVRVHDHLNRQLNRVGGSTSAGPADR